MFTSALLARHESDVSLGETFFMGWSKDMENLKDGAPVRILQIKKAKTFVEQVALIKNKGFVVEDGRECECFLNKASYHRLSEYFLPFLGSDGTCCQKINFRRIQRIYEFDANMRGALLRCTDEIELYLRTQLAYFCGHKYGALGYLDESVFSENPKKHNHEEFLRHIYKSIEKNNRTSVVRDYMENYDGKFPIWVIIEFFPMGMLTSFYRGLKPDDQACLADGMYGTSPRHLISWLECLRNLRNRCAHCARLYYWKFPPLPRLPKNIPFAVNNRLFTQILTLKFLYPRPQKRWDFGPLVEIENLMADYENDVSLKHIGFPENWRELLRKAAVQ